MRNFFYYSALILLDIDNPELKIEKTYVDGLIMKNAIIANHLR